MKKTINIATDTILKSIFLGLTIGIILFILPKLLSAKDDILVSIGLLIVLIYVILGIIWFRIEITKRRKGNGK